MARITLLESRTKIDLNEAALLTYCVLDWSETAFGEPVVVEIVSPLSETVL